MYKKQVENIFKNIKSLVPKTTLVTCAEWAEAHRYMNSKITGRTGQFSFANAPYCREICETLSKSSSTQQVAIMKGVQLGFTTSVIENLIGYLMDLNPTGIMFVFPSEQTAKDYKSVKIDNLIDNSGLRAKITAQTQDRNTRKTGDTSTLVEFKGGMLLFASANNAKQLRSHPVKYILMDELDGYPEVLKNEGDPVEIAAHRVDSYLDSGAKVLYNSTPTKAHNSKIKKYYDKGDCRKFFVPCPHCGEYQELVFYKSDGGEYSDDKAVIKNKTKTKPYGVLFDKEACKTGDYSSVRYRCKHCGEEFNDSYKYTIEQRGEWRPTQKSKIPFFRSYHLSALYSLTKSWWKIVSEFIEAGNDPKLLQTFVNLNLGEPFEDRMGGVEYQQVQRLRDTKMPNNVVPEEALIMTCVADVQRDRIECEIKAWGDRYRCWGIDHRVFYGKTSDLYDPCWAEFLKIKDEVFTDGRLVENILVDSGDGELRDVVYSFCDTFGENLIMPLKGFLSTSRTREKFRIVEIKEFPNIALVEIYVDLYKNTLSRYLSQEERIDDIYPDGWFTFANGYSDEYFRQLTTERKIKTVTPGGLTTIKWVQHGRNEAFDLNVYSLAAVDMLIQQYSIIKLGYENSNPREVFETLKKEQQVKKLKIQKR